MTSKGGDVGEGDWEAELAHLMDTGTIAQVRDYVRVLRAQAREEGRNEATKEALRISDEIEMGTPNTHFDEWRAFKRFRNSLRDWAGRNSH